MGNQHTRYKDLTTDEARAKYRARWAGVRDNEWSDYKVNLVKKTNTCLRGHTRTEKNTYVSPAGKKNCRVCKALRDKGAVRTYPEYSRKKKQERTGYVEAATPVAPIAIPQPTRPKWRPEGFSAEPRIPIDYTERHGQWQSSGGVAGTETPSEGWKAEQDFTETVTPTVSDMPLSMTTTSG